jgi:hypothetical protein
MGEARRRRERLAHLLADLPNRGEPRELTGRQAAELYARREHLVIPVDQQSRVQIELLGALAQIFGSELAIIRTLPALDTSLPRPRLSIIYPGSYFEAERRYPPLLIAFIRDTRQNRASIDAAMGLLAAVRRAEVCGRLETFTERGAVLLFDSELSDGVNIALTMFDQLYQGTADDLSMH